ncbi:MAG TPA: sugar kinase [Pyrinomonadaceae bacterium]|jgi:2-dehydro-3-deoxygluconokinase
MSLEIKPKKDCRWDFVSLGEVMLRFDPENERIHNARTFRVWEGGGEYNVARSLSKVFRLDAAIVTALADNQIGRLVEDLIWQGGVDSSEILWRETDGISRRVRNGMYFIERGFGLRPPVGCSDRGNTAVSQLKNGDIDWQKIFAESGARWFHTGGIFAGLSETTADVALEAMQTAKASGAIVSYDLNYRDSLWSERGGRDAANALNHKLLPFSDVVFGVENFKAGFGDYNEEIFARAAGEIVSRFPDLKVIATTLRDVKSASRHDLSAVCLADGKVFKADDFADLEVLDRVGSGDAFAAGLIYGLLAGKDFAYAIKAGAANSALTMTTPGDGSSATLAEVEKLIHSRELNLSR